MTKGSCSFTGHRRIKSEHMADLPGLLEKGIEYAYNMGCRRFLAGGAIGFDTLAAEAVINFRRTHPEIKLILLLPCRTQSAGWSEDDKIKYREILRLSDEVRYISNEYTDTCMKERNQVLADEAEVLIAYVERRNSGSGQTLRMANGKEIFNLFSALEKRMRK